MAGGNDINVERVRNLRMKLAEEHGVTLEVFESPEFQEKLAKERAEFEKQQLDDAPFHKFDEQERNRLKRSVAKSGGLVAIAFALVCYYVLGRPAVIWRNIFLVSFSSVAAYCLYGHLVFDRVFAIRPNSIADVKRTWESRWGVYATINAVLTWVGAIIFLLWAFHANMSPAPCHSKCHWCRQAIEDFHDRDPPERRP